VVDQWPNDLRLYDHEPRFVCRGRRVRLGPATASSTGWRLGARCAGRSHKEIGPCPKFCANSATNAPNLCSVAGETTMTKLHPVHLLQANLAAARLKVVETLAAN
jgi:hypothetical protein